MTLPLSNVAKLGLAREIAKRATDITEAIDISHAPWWKRYPIAILRFGRQKLHLYELGAIAGIVTGREAPRDGKLH